MSTSNATKIDVLALLFNSVPLPGTWTSNLFLALHTASPGDAGNQSTSEVAYTGYGRVSTTRNGTSGWQAPNGTGQLGNVNALQFGIRSDAGTAVVATHASLGLASGQIVAYGPLATPATIVQNSVPSFPVGTIIVQVVWAVALAPPKSGLFVQLPRAGVPSTPESGGGGSGTPVPIYCSATMLVNLQFPAVTQHQVVLRLGTTMSMSVAMAADASAAPALPDPGIGNALLVDTLGNYLVDTNGDYLYGKEP